MQTDSADLSRSREAEGPDKSPDCRIGSDSDFKPAALETSFDCEHCHTRIPASVAISFDGADYIYHFCGAQCIEAWCKKVGLL